MYSIIYFWPVYSKALVPVPVPSQCFFDLLLEWEVFYQHHLLIFNVPFPQLQDRSIPWARLRFPALFIILLLPSRNGPIPLVISELYKIKIQDWKWTYLLELCILCKLTYILRFSKQGFVYTFMLFHSDLINVAIKILKRLFYFSHNV